MSHDPVASRYAQALFETLNIQGRLDAVASSLKELHGLIADHEALRRFLENPDAPTADKVHILERVLGDAWSEDLRAFVQMVLGMGRAECLQPIAEAFSELVDAQRGLLHVRVRSARPLPAALKARLTQTLERREHRTIELLEDTDPALLGGLQILLDHRMLDGSLRAQLDTLRRWLTSVTVH